MARKRMIDPEFWSDEQVGKWSFQSRLFYIGLWNFADDEGRFKSNDALLKAQIFPYDKKININRLKQELGNKIQWYESEGSQYGFIRNFLKYQKIDHPTESKLPVPPPFIPESSPNVQGDVPPNIIEVNISKYNINKDKYLDFVYLTKDEYDKLTDKFGTGTQDKIQALNDYLGSKGVRYKSHYHTILNWARRDDTKRVISTGKKKLFPISGKTCSFKNCGMPAVYKMTGGDFDSYRCGVHLPEKVAKEYEAA